MARKREEIAQLLASKFLSESKRLNSWGTKTDSKAAITFAMAVVDFVRALMSESRYRELKRMNRLRSKASDSDDFNKRFDKYVSERMKATSSMTKAIEKFALEKEEKRPWKPKEKSKEHKHKHKHHHHHHHHSHKEKK
jgi:hypothetical protein